MDYTHCNICDALVPNIDGPVSDQVYLPQSPGCWKLYTDVLAREYGEWGYPDIHRLTVDAYASQHPTKKPNRKSAQSITLHLIGLYLALEKNIPSREITKIIEEIVQKNKANFQWFEPPHNLGDITIAEVHKATNLDEHIIRVNSWSKSVWAAWSDYHDSFVSISAR